MNSFQRESPGAMDKAGRELKLGHAEAYLSEVRDIADRIDRTSIEKMIRRLVEIRERSGRLFFLGVGGSAANASHAVNPSYLYRSGAPNALDALWAEKLGKRAVRVLAEGATGPNLLTIQKSKEGFYPAEKPLSNFGSIEELHRKVDRRFYDPVGFAMSEAGRRYMKEIVREIPDDPDYGLGRVTQERSASAG